MDTCEWLCSDTATAGSCSIHRPQRLFVPSCPLSQGLTTPPHKEKEQLWCRISHAAHNARQTCGIKAPKVTTQNLECSDTDCESGSSPCPRRTSGPDRPKLDICRGLTRTKAGQSAAPNPTMPSDGRWSEEEEPHLGSNSTKQNSSGENASLPSPHPRPVKHACCLQSKGRATNTEGISAVCGFISPVPGMEPRALSTVSRGSPSHTPAECTLIATILLYGRERPPAAN